MKSEEIFEMFNDIDDSFVDAAFSNAEKSEVVQPQEIHMTKRRFPWGIAAAAAACLAVCAAVGAVIAANTGKSKIPVEPNSPLQFEPIIPPAEEIYVGSFSDSVSPATFTMEEFGKDVEFTIDETRVIRKDKNGNTTPLIGFPKIFRVCLGDLNGDGKREIIAEGWNGLSGLSANFIQAYDLENSKYYILGMAEYCHDIIGDCGIEIKDGIVYVRLEKFGETGFTDIMPLTLDMMYEVDENYNPEVEVVLDSGINRDSFTMPEYPDYKFIIENGDITAKNTKTGESKRLLNTAEIKKIYLYDDYCTYKREIYAIAKRPGEQNTIQCYVFLDKDGNFSTTYIEPNEKGYDMDMEIQDGRILWKDSSPIDHGFSERCENDLAALTVSSPSVKHSILQSGIAIRVTLENKTDNTLYLYSYVPADMANMFIHTSASRDDGKTLSIKEDFGDIWITEKVNYYPIPPNSTVDVDMLFSLENAQAGTYNGICTVDITDTPDDSSPKMDLSVKFQLKLEGDVSETGNVTDPNTSDNPATDPGVSTEPEPLYSFFENDKLRLQVELEKSAYKKGDIITVDAEVTNKSDKKFYIFVPTATSNTHTEIRTYISLDGRRLNDIDAVQYWDDAIELIPLEPGESFTLKKVRFDTTYTGDESLGISKQPVQSGIYQGTTEITIMESTDFQTPAESYYTSFAISIM